MVWTRASTSAWLSGESLGRSVGCCSAEGTTLLDGSERRPPRSAAATVAASLDSAADVDTAAAGATAATAEARAARRANSRREMPLGADGFLGSSLIIDRYGLFFMVRKEATERVREGQRLKLGADSKKTPVRGGECTAIVNRNMP